MAKDVHVQRFFSLVKLPIVFGKLVLGSLTVMSGTVALDTGN
jgi:hypothetical protein